MAIGALNKQPKILTEVDWSDIGYRIFSGVRHACAHAHPIPNVSAAAPYTASASNWTAKSLRARKVGSGYPGRQPHRRRLRPYRLRAWENRIVVTFKAKLDQTESCLGKRAYAYREYTEDMVDTGNDGIINCQAGPDVGGLFVGDVFYYASMGWDNTNIVGGWDLTKYNAVTWTSLVDTFFYPLATGKDAGDPMLAVINGQIDVSSTYKSDLKASPYKSYTTHHQFFTADLQFVSKRVLSDTPHMNLSSLVTAGGVINFVTGTALLGDVIVMQYDPSWSYLGTMTLKQHSAAPEGAAFDGKRFYVAYVDVSSGTDWPCYMNVRLAAFDSNWNLLDDIALTSFVPQDHKQPGRPSLTLRNGRIYVCFDENEDETFTPDENPDTSDYQVHVMVYELTQKP